MLRVVISGILAISGLGIFTTSKEIFISLPARSEFAGHFALLSLLGLGLILIACYFLSLPAPKIRGA